MFLVECFLFVFWWVVFWWGFGVFWLDSTLLMATHHMAIAYYSHVIEV